MVNFKPCLMIKKTIRLTSYVLIMLGFGAAEGCGGGDEEKKEEEADCYECTEGSDTYTYCFSDFKEDYGWSRAEFDEYIDYLEADGYNCKAIE